MLPSESARLAIVWLTSGAIALAAPMIVWAAILLARRRPVPVLLMRAILVAAGLVLGFLLLGVGDLPTPRLVALILSVVIVALIASTRPRTAGAVLVAIAVPPTLWWGSFLADNAVAGRHWVVADVLTPLIFGATAVIAGLWLYGWGGQRERALHPVQVIVPDERKFGAAAMALTGPKIFGLATYELASGISLFVIAVATVSLLHGRAFVEGALVAIGGVLVGWAVCSVTFVLARRPNDRRAWEAFSWMGEWELDRYRAVAGGPMLPTKGDFQKWLKASPDDPRLGWIRSELFVMERCFDDARAATEAMPVDTPYDRVERESALASIDWYTGGPGDTAELRAAADAVLPADGEEGLRAEVTFAVAEVRRLLSVGDPDPARPMREARDRLGARADGILWTMLRRRLWSKLLYSAAVIVGGLTLLDRIFTLA